jgi:UDP-N-acetyl-D-galactosamine dehydrogenase
MRDAMTGKGPAHGRSIAVIGLGYVGLPVAVAFATSGVPVVGFDVDAGRIAELSEGRDRTREIEPDDLARAPVTYTADPAGLAAADFFIVTVPTPIDDANRPDLGKVIAASRTVGAALRPGAIVVYESTVYPGVTEEVCVPVLEAASGLAAGRDFTVGYSPERINPGDRTRRFETLTKVVSGQDAATLETVAAVYASVVTAGVHRAPSIKVAEAAKAIENAQRDLNIAFMNELSEICAAIGIDTHDVLAAAATKWNFLRFTPGLVGGHCIGVDPYYLTYRAEQAGIHPQVILAGRRINDAVGSRVAIECVRLLLKRGTMARRVAVLGLTFKEDVPDIRNSRVVDVVRTLEGFGMTVGVHDPIADAGAAEREYGLRLHPLSDLAGADAVIVAVAHADYVAGGWGLVRGLLGPAGGPVLDVKAILPRDERPADVDLWRL